MTRLLIQIGAGIVAALLLVVAVMWVIGLGPFNTRPSVAAKQLPKVTAAVTKTQTQAGAAVAKADTQAKTTIAAAEKRTEGHVAKIRAAPDGASDAEFYRSVCDTQLYEGSADCSGFSRQPEGDGTAHRPRALRSR